MNFYNDNDPYVAQWLGNLVATGHLPQGTVDARSILNVEPDDVRLFRQCHFFAGIGGWPLALTLAGWPDDREVWTASLPCQPLSSAGQRSGHLDRRHFWPAFYRLVAERRPATIFGEQVASKDGREWLAGIRADLEHLGYAVGAADLPAASLGAPQIRQRLFWMAHTEGRFGTGGLGDTAGGRREESPQPYQREEQSRQPASRWANVERSDAWSTAVWLPCLDGKARRVEPSIQPLASGVPGRVGRLRAYGNAIVPQVAAEFIKAYNGQA